jgi:hypothetical protein
MIDPTQLSKELESLGQKAFSPEITQGLEKAASEFKALNTEMVGRLKPAMTNVAGELAKQAPALESLAGNLAGSLSGPLANVAKNLEGIAPNLKSALPRVGEELNNGLKGISPILSDFPKEVEEGLPKFLKAATTVTVNLQHAIPGLQKPLAEMTESLPGVAAKLKPELESAATTISSAITGSEVKNAFNNIALALPTPQAVAEVTSAMSKAAKNVIPALELIQSSEIEVVLKAQLDGIQGDLAGAAAGLSGILSEMKIPDFNIPNIGNIINTNLSGLTEKLNGNLSKLLNTVTGSPVLDALHSANKTINVMKGTLGISANLPDVDLVLGNVVKEFTNGTVAGALNVLQEGSKIDLDITATLTGATGNLANNISGFGNLASKATQFADVVSKLKQPVSLGINVAADLSGFESKLGSLQSQFGSAAAMLSGATGLLSTSPINQATTLAKVQPTVNNVEEVFAETVSSPTQPKAMEVSWTETYKDEIVNKDTIQPKNYYHYIVLPSGIIQRDKQIGNDELIRVAVVGGYNVFKGEKGSLTSDSITHTQTFAVKRIIEQTIKAMPGIQVYGKGEFVTEGGRGGGSLDPGIDIDKITKSIDGRSSTPPEDAVAPKTDSELGKPIGPRVVYLWGTEEFQKKKTRNRLIQPNLMKIINGAAEQADVYVTIFSGGQMPRAEVLAKGGVKRGDTWYIPGGPPQGVATGSVRHDNGYAADVWLYSDPDRKNTINASVWDNPPAKALNFIRACKALGARSVGVGPKYMEPGIHVDLNPGLYWGAKGLPENAPEWLRNIMA